MSRFGGGWHSGEAMVILPDLIQQEIQSMTDLVISRLEGHVLHVELNRPEAKHALNTEMYEALVAIFADARHDDEVRVMLFKGGRGCFLAGNDINDFLTQPVLSEGTAVLAFLHELASFDKPLIAAVAGPAPGVGTTFLLHCDLVYATSSAIFSMPFVNLGVSPEAASTYLLPRFLGHVRAAELLLLGERISPERALELGLINAIVDEADYWEHAAAQAEKIAAKPVDAVRATKRLLRSHSAMIHQVIDTEARQFVQLRDSEEARAIFRGFLKK